jgi:hypothetical protein
MNQLLQVVMKWFYYNGPAIFDFLVLAYHNIKDCAKIVPFAYPQQLLAYPVGYPPPPHVENHCNRLMQCFSTGVPQDILPKLLMFFVFFIILTLGGEASLVQNLPNREFPDCI